MEICLNPFRYNSKPVNFGVTRVAYKEKMGFKIIRNSTRLFRDDLRWFDLAQSMGLHFQKKDKVNVYSAACSDGSEAYSLVMALIHCLGEKESQKFFPIFASDKNRQIINIAKRKFLNLYSRELEQVPEIDRYFEKAPSKISIPDEDPLVVPTTQTYLVRPELSGRVEFSREHLEDRIKNIKDNGNTVLMCRNVLPYLDGIVEVSELIKEISARLKPGSLFAVGSFDFFKIPQLRRFLSDAGFRRFDGINHVYQRIDIK